MLMPELQDIDLEFFMREALAESEAAGAAGELPIGSVIVLDGKIISRGRARHREHQNQIRHAELNALLDAGEKLWVDYQRAILFTSVEPCPMCLGAVVMADIPHIIFAIHDNNVQSKFSVENNSYIQRHIKSYHGGVLEAEAKRIFAKYRQKDLEYIESYD
jgi:tRNA(adenine34) deaminase